MIYCNWSYIQDTKWFKLLKRCDTVGFMSLFLTALLCSNIFIFNFLELSSTQIEPCGHFAKWTTHSLWQFKQYLMWIFFPTIENDRIHPLLSHYFIMSKVHIDKILSELLWVSLANFLPTSLDIELTGTSPPAILLKFVILQRNLAHARHRSVLFLVSREQHKLLKNSVITNRKKRISSILTALNK